MNQELLKALATITEEEQRLLDGGHVDMEVYSSGKAFVVDREKLLSRGEMIMIRPHTRFAEFPKHRHNYTEMMYMCSGETIHTVNDMVSLTLRSGELLLLNQHASHAIARAGETDIAVNFVVLPSFFDIALDMIGADNVLGKFLVDSLKEVANVPGFLHFCVADVLPVQNLVENLLLSLVNRQSNSRNINQKTMGLLFLQLLNCTERLAIQPEPNHGSRLVIRVLREIEENYSGVQLSDIAKQQEVTVPYLSRHIHEMTGRSFKQLLMEKRLAKAAALLEQSNLSVQDIIAIVGYENTSFFYRAFRKKFGMSPREYRSE